MSHENEDIEEGDWTTEDHATFFSYGKKVLSISRDATTTEMWRAIDAKMEKDGFFPTVWFISDHGNAHVMKRPKGYRRKKADKVGKVGALGAGPSFGSTLALAAVATVAYFIGKSKS